jgi:hypothetical protein
MTEQFKTGDKHPVHNLLAFVEYDGSGCAVWTSIAEDRSAPFRLAKENARRRLADTAICQSTSDTGAYRGQGSRRADSSPEPLPHSDQSG